MRRNISRLLVVLLLSATCLTPACARLGAGTAAGSGAGISVSDALTQAQGAAKAITTLTQDQSSPLSAETKAQVANWSAWLDFALRAGGIVASVVAGS